MTIINGIDYGYLSEAHSSVTSAVDAYRNQILNDKFIWNGKQWDSSEVSRANINGACTIALLNGGNLPDGFIWRDYNNTNWPVTAADMGGMAAACATFTFTCYQVAWFHKSNLLGITDENQILDVLNYDYTIGWPSTEL